MTCGEERIRVGDQGILYCPACGNCECCTDGFAAAHAGADFECFVGRGECHWKPDALDAVIAPGGHKCDRDTWPCVDHDHGDEDTASMGCA